VLLAKVQGTNKRKMTIKDYLNRQFGEIINRLEQLESKIGNGRQITAGQNTYNTKEAAKLLGVTTRTLLEYRKQRQISFVQNGRKILFTQAHIDAFLESFKVNSKTFKTKSHGNQ
jgi:excisionase family DNA binding protein